MCHIYLFLIVSPFRPKKSFGLKNLAISVYTYTTYVFPGVIKGYRIKLEYSICDILVRLITIRYYVKQMFFAEVISNACRLSFKCLSSVFSTSRYCPRSDLGLGKGNRVV